MKNIVLIGPPGSGKGTISLELKKQGYIHISTGDLLREEVASGSDLGKEIAERIDNGLMVNDELSLKVMQKAMKQQKDGYLFDGYPRNKKQAELLEEHLINNDTDNLVILDFNIDKKKLTDRILNRLNCTQCGAIYNLRDLPPTIENNEYQCTFCGAELKKRKDDNEESLATRFDIFSEKTQPVIDYYSTFQLYNKINADQERKNILKDVNKILAD